MKHLIVVGAGLVGLSTTRAALASGYKVTVLEQGPLPNPNAASCDQHRLIRYQYGRAAGYTRMVSHAFDVWEKVWGDLGETLFEKTGTLGIAHGSNDYVAQSLATFEDLGIPHERLTSTEIERIAPQLTLPEDAWGLLNADGGVLLAERIVDGLLAWNRSQGAVMRAHCRVEHVDLERASVRLIDGEVLEGDVLVVATGAWLGELLPSHALPTYRQAVCYVEGPEAMMAHWRNGPSLTDIGIGDNYALMPVRGTGLKFGSGAHRRAGSPTDGFGAELAEGYEVIAPFAPYLRYAEGYRPVRMAVGYYVKDSSEKFRIDTIGKSMVVTNCDGQMFKFGPLVGERLIACADGKISAGELQGWAAGA
ncbi:FAD-dependent oxidoreductase [Mesorhizobium sp. M0013]|uniref:FAD-dependent oxidoreductase n=1 Tax=Mesorhizobium sp. M0013 TaxID=2956841 RepID=UPI003335AF84